MLISADTYISYHVPGVYHIGDVEARSWNVIVVPGRGFTLKRFAL
jgi:hypothetical protein